MSEESVSTVDATARIKDEDHGPSSPAGTSTANTKSY